MAEPTDSEVHVAVADGVQFWTLNAPQRRNALNDGMVNALLAALERAELNTGTRALVLRGAGGNFCAGGDLEQFKLLMATPAPASNGADPIALHNRNFGKLLERLADTPLPLFVAADGAVMGGGVGLACVADFVLATAAAQFALPENTLGLPPAQVAPFVAARLGAPLAKRLMMTGQRLAAADAQRLGLVDQVCPDAATLGETLLFTLNHVLRAEPQSLRATKRILAQRDGRGEQLDFAAERFAQALRSGTAAMGLKAFAEKRAPLWHKQIARLPEMPA